MAATLETLRKLHRIHQQLGDLRDRLERGPKKIAARRHAVSQLEKQLEETREAAKHARSGADQKELLLKSLESKIGDLKVKLNQAKANREYQILEEQIAADEMAASVMADEILDAIDRADEVRRRVPEIEKQLELAREDLKTVEASVRESAAGLEQDVARLQVELEATEEALPREGAERYRRVVKKMGPEALAAVENMSCTGCHSRATNNLYNELLLGKLVYCPSCGRLMYLPESPGRPGFAQSDG